MGSHRKKVVNVGERCGMMTIIKEVEKRYVKSNPYPVRMVELKCDCGNVAIRPFTSLKRSKSCGCIRGFSLETHGLSKTRIHSIWQQKNKLMCEEWRNSFKSFYDWAVIKGYNKELFLSKISPNECYSPTNSLWSQSRDNIKSLHKANGVIKLIVDNSEKYIIRYKGLKHRAAIINIWKKILKRDFTIELIPNWDIWNGKF